MIDPQRLEQIDRWAEYVKTSDGEWKKHHSAFINAQFENSYSFYKRLAKQPGGVETIIGLFQIKNPKLVTMVESWATQP